MTPNRLTEQRQLFVLRRALWLGRATRAEVVEVFGVSTATASEALSAAAAMWPNALVRKPKWVERARHPEIPEEASAITMMALVDNGSDNFAQLGLSAGELPVLRPRTSRLMPSSPQAMSTILSAVVAGEPLEIKYVGLRIGESARWRRIYPVALEQSAGQWRLLAQDLDGGVDSEGFYGLRVFVLPRIIDAVLDNRRLPKDFVPTKGIDREIPHRVTLHYGMTDDQRTAIRNEMGIKGGDDVIRLPSRAVYEFKRRYMDERSNDANIVWPVIAHIEESD